MLLFKKIIYVSMFFVSACGFSPVYTSHNSSKATGQVSIQEPNTQNEFIFYSLLVDRFGESEGRYILNYAISTSTKDRALNFDGTVHRIEKFASVAFSLKDTENGNELISDQEETYLSYSNFGSTAAILNADRNTTKQILAILGEKVADRVYLVILEKDS